VDPPRRRRVGSSRRRRDRCRRHLVVVVHLHHLLLAVIVVAIAPLPALARQHCHRCHNCLCGSLPISSSPPSSAVLLEDSLNPPFCLPPPPDAVTVSSLSSTPPPPPPPRRHHHHDRPTTCLRDCLLLLPPPTLIALSTARFRYSQRDDIAVTVIAATSTSLPNDNVRPQWSVKAQWTAGRQQRLPPLTATTSNPPLSRSPSHLPPNVDCCVLSPPLTAARRCQHPDIIIAPPTRHHPTTAPLQ